MQHGQRLPLHGFSDDSIARVAAMGGEAAVNALAEFGIIVTQQGYFQEDIALIASRRDGMHTLEALAHHGQELFQAGFSHINILRIAMHGGAGALDTMTEAAHLLTQQGHSHDNITRMAARRDGAQVLHAVAQHGQRFSQDGLTHHDIVRIAISGGADALHATAEVGHDLIQSDHAPSSIVGIAASTNGAQHLRVFARENQTDFTTEDARSAEEIARTAQLHRSAPALGLDDLPQMRTDLGNSTVCTVEQRERAKTYIARLQQIEEFHNAQNWSALREAAHAIQEHVTNDYEQHLIIGSDYASIADQLAIIFRSVPDPESFRAPEA
ncbi:TAL effector repeat-containing protein [Xanthomonas oryzae]|uniref:TAL effector repeat-containing protein n=1 Tax=Xanthomonas oryzae TaxID=347 RepID=UPI0013054105|nr:TAL effector repeat-containing protein [Xanthomonas oryzae]